MLELIISLVVLGFNLLVYFLFPVFLAIGVIGFILTLGSD